MTVSRNLGFDLKMKNKKNANCRFKNGGGWLAASGAVLTAMGLSTTTARAHGFVGDRFFPPTIQTDDPFAVDELAFPTVSAFQNPGETDVGFSFSKEIFPKFALSFSETYVNLAPDGNAVGRRI